MSHSLADSIVAIEADKPAFAIQDLLPYQLYQIGAIHERIVYTNMFRMTNITLAEWRVMGNIASGICTFTELAKELILDKGQLSNIITHQHRKGLVEKRKSTTDGRKTYLVLSSLGEERTKFIVKMANNFQTLITQGISEEEQLILRKALNQVDHNIRSFWSVNNA